MSTGGRLSKVWLTHTDVASHWSAGGFIRLEEWIISPASLSICWTFPHSSIVACWRYFWMVEMWTPNHVEEQQWLILINLIVTMYCLCLVEQQHKDTGVCRYGVTSLQGHGIRGVCQVEFLWIQREQSVVWWFTQRGFDSQARQRRVEWDLQVKDKYKSGSLL